MSEVKQKGKTVKAKAIPRPPSEDEITKSYYLVAYYYPQYTLQDAAKLPYHHVIKLLRTAKQEKATEYLNLLNISSAPHTRKGQGVKKLATEYRNAIGD